MSADYREQYRPDQLEPFFPNEIMKMTVAVLCTLAVIMFFAILPVLLDAVGIHGAHHEEPANPQGATPQGIKPEWYFLAVYQYLRLMPTELFRISGKTLGVLSQGVFVTVIILLPFWYRKRATERPTRDYRVGVTACVAAFAILTIWGGWPETEGGGMQAASLPQRVMYNPFLRHGIKAACAASILIALVRRRYGTAGATFMISVPILLLYELVCDRELVPIKDYFFHNPMIFIIIAAGLLVFYLLIAHERRAIRLILDDPMPQRQEEHP